MKNEHARQRIPVLAKNDNGEIGRKAESRHIASKAKNLLGKWGDNAARGG
jgi:hypothetical protein